MKILLVYPNDRMDGLISVGISVLSAHLKAETNTELYKELMEEYERKELFNRKSREKSISSIDENISAQDIFINDEGTVVM